jgi:hypothetical protein
VGCQRVERDLVQPTGVAIRGWIYPEVWQVFLPYELQSAIFAITYAAMQRCRIEDPGLTEPCLGEAGWYGTAPVSSERTTMRPILLWLVGIPIPVIILLYLFDVL